MVSLFYGAKKADAQCKSRGVSQAHHDRLWAWLQRAKYKNWDLVGDDFQPGQSPHGALIKTYLRGAVAKDPDKLPYGSVIVKENYSPDKKLMAITVMQRSKGYDTKNGDWYYAKYMPNGQIAKTPPEMKSMPIAGRFKSCIECHSGADGDDFAFFND